MAKVKYSLKKIPHGKGTYELGKNGTIAVNGSPRWSPNYETIDTVESLYVSPSVTYIPQQAFELSYNLKRISFSVGLKEVCAGAFKGCRSLKHLVLPKGLKKIQAEAFAKCDRLQIVSLAKGLDEVAPDAFKGCTGITHVIYHSSLEEMLPSIFPDSTWRTAEFLPVESDEPIPSGAMTEEGLTSVLASLSCVDAQQIAESDIEAVFHETAPKKVAKPKSEDIAERAQSDLAGYMKLVLAAEQNVQTAALYLIGTRRTIKAIQHLRKPMSSLAKEETLSLKEEMKELKSVGGRQEYLKRRRGLPKRPTMPKLPQKAPLETYGALVKPPQPKEPQYERPGLFNRRKVEERNRVMKESYEEKKAAYDSAWKEYCNRRSRLQAMSDRDYEEAMSKYEEEMSEYRAALLERKAAEEALIAKRIDDLEAEIENLDFSSTVFKTVLDIYRAEEREAKKALRKGLALLEQLYSLDIIFPKYRNLPAVATMCEYLETGRCSELSGADGAYNLYESEIRAERVITQLNMIQESLDEIKQNQFMLFNSIEGIRGSIVTMSRSMSNQLSGLRWSVDDIAEDVANIKESSAAAAHFAKVNAELAGQERTFFGIAF